MRLNYFITVLALLLCSHSAFSQDEINTDRPDQTETPSIVPAGRFQMETGLKHTRTDKRSKEFSLPETLLKLGLNERVELRLITPLAYNKYNDTIDSGLGPITVGFKANLLTGKGLLPETSFIAHLILPKAASKDLQAKLLAPELLLLFENKLSDNTDLGYNIGVKWDGRCPQTIYTYTLSPNFTLTNKLKAFVESFGCLPEHQHPEHWVDGDFMFLLTKNIQLDIATGYELTAHQHFHEYYETMGISFRI
jgi:Putative MetA-pathway of phenol degradation